MEIEIFMPFYGDVEYFKTAVLSVLAQTDPDWRLTILDDRYPSEEPEVFIRNLKDPRISYLRNEINLGVSGNFQQCIDLAQADFINIMGCDDVMRENYVARAKEIIHADSNISYIQPGVEVVDEKGNVYLPLGDRVKNRLRNKFSPPCTVSSEEIASSLLKGCWTYFPSIIWKTTELKKYNFRKEFSIVLDLALQLEIIANGGKVFIDSPVSFAYRRHRSSVSMSSSLEGKRCSEEGQLFSEFATTAQGLGWNKAERAARLHLTSRVNALLEIPPAIWTRKFTGAKTLFRFAVSKY